MGHQYLIVEGGGCSDTELIGTPAYLLVSLLEDVQQPPGRLPHCQSSEWELGFTLHTSGSRCRLLEV